MGERYAILFLVLNLLFQWKSSPIHNLAKDLLVSLHVEENELGYLALGVLVWGLYPCFLTTLALLLQVERNCSPAHMEGTIIQYFCPVMLQLELDMGKQVT